MWRGYCESGKCYAYLNIVVAQGQGSHRVLARSKWFTKGWTLQELLAIQFCVETLKGIRLKSGEIRLKVGLLRKHGNRIFIAISRRFTQGHVMLHSLLSALPFPYFLTLNARAFSMSLV
jgi:hypothetical protein